MSPPCNPCLTPIVGGFSLAEIYRITMAQNGNIELTQQSSMYSDIAPTPFSH